MDDTMTSKDTQAVETNLNELSERLDNILNGTENMNTELDNMKELIDKQNKVIEKQMAEIRELKNVNLQLANHNPNQKPQTIEEMLGAAFVH